MDVENNVVVKVCRISVIGEGSLSWETESFDADGITFAASPNGRAAVRDDFFAQDLFDKIDARSRVLDCVKIKVFHGYFVPMFE